MATVSTSFSENTVECGIDSEPLPCFDHADFELNTQHPFVAFKETNRSSGAWRIRIHTRDTDPVVLYPNALRLQARAVSARGQSWFNWSNSAGEHEKLKFRVYVDHGEPAAVEVLPRDNQSLAAAPSPALKFCWPSA